MKLYLYNTLTKSKEEFIPINSAQVGIYSCGPTVYSAQHLGNMRATFVVDLLKNTLKYPCGYTTKHVMNITDV
jgi:cysteinyl-tRNA synthetase